MPGLFYWKKYPAAALICLTIHITKGGNKFMKQISGNKLLVKALKEEGVDVLFGYPGACTIDISDE